MEKIKIGFISSFNPVDKKASSGTNYKITKELLQIGNIEWIPIKPTKFTFFFKGFQKLWNIISPKPLILQYTPIGSKLFYKKINKNLDNYDIIVAFFCGDYLYRIKTKRPIIYVSDTTFPAMIDYYKPWTNLFKWNINAGNRIEQKSLENANQLIFCSDWAAMSAKQDLGQDKKINVLELGANIDEKDLSLETKKISTPINLIFFGVDWERKGGEIAVECLNWLNNNNIPTILHIIGIKNLPQIHKDNNKIINHGFLDKNNKDDYNKIINVLNKGHFLILPTKAECAGIVFSEASAFGLPSLTYKTGGTTNYVINNKNGYTLDLNKDGNEFGKVIKKIIDNKEYNKLSENTVKIYKEKLNWNKWGKEIKEIIYNLINEND